MSEELKLALFDCDGTLVDGQHMIINAMRQASKICNIPYAGDDKVRHIVGLSLHEAILNIYPDLTENDYSLLHKNFVEHFQYLRTLKDHDEPLYEGIKDTILELNKMGIILGVATGKSTRGLINTLDNHGLKDYFVTLNTADDGPGKPNPAMINAALSDTGVLRANTYMIGDTTYDMVMAKQAGVHSVGVTWGYHETHDLVLSGADHIIDHISEFIDLIKIK